ncbi:MAG: hypothetical protein GX561_12980 [Lentisphaerae bacterium]|nr:hypothetical protein [Lentisphaerota bacterium]
MALPRWASERFCAASEQYGFRYGHPGCSYSSCVAAEAAKHGASPVGRAGGFALLRSNTVLGTGTRGARTQTMAPLKR